MPDTLLVTRDTILSKKRQSPALEGLIVHWGRHILTTPPNF